MYVISKYSCCFCQVCDQHGVLRAQLSLWKFGGGFLLELCCVRIGGNSCVSPGDVFGRETSRSILEHAPPVTMWQILFHLCCCCCYCRVNRRFPLIAYYIIGGIALISVFFIQVSGTIIQTVFILLKYENSQTNV